MMQEQDIVNKRSPVFTVICLSTKVIKVWGILILMPSFEIEHSYHLKYKIRKAVQEDLNEI